MITPHETVLVYSVAVRRVMILHIRRELTNGCTILNRRCLLAGGREIYDNTYLVIRSSTVLTNGYPA